MRIKNDDVLAHLRSFGFTMQENNAQGFIRWQKRIGDMLVTIANGQFENKIRVSLLQDRNGNIRTSYKDILAYTELICSLQDEMCIRDRQSRISLGYWRMVISSSSCVTANSVLSFI